MMDTTAAPANVPVTRSGGHLEWLTGRPLVPATALFVVGIMAGRLLVGSFILPLALLSIAVLAGVLLRRNGVAKTICLLLGCAACGAGRWWTAEFDMAHSIAHLNHRTVRLQGTVVGMPKAADSFAAVQVSVDRVTSVGSSWVAGSGNVVARLAMGSHGGSPEPGDRLELMGELEIPRPATVPGAFDAAQYYGNREVSAEMFVASRANWRLVSSSWVSLHTLERLAWNIRASMLAAWARSIPSSDVAVIQGVVLGDRTALTSDLKEALERTGTVHIVATAGLHVGLLALLLAAALRRCGLSPRTVALIVLPTIGMYALIAGARPSVVRAAVLVMLYYAAALVDREPDVWSAMAAAALLLLLVSPGYLFDPGFQLSFATVITIVAISQIRGRQIESTLPGVPRTHPLLGKIREYALDLILVCAAAQAGAAPLTAQVYNQIAITGGAANVFVVPLVPVVLSLASVVWLAGCVYTPWAAFVGRWLLHPTVWLLVRTVRLFSAAPVASIAVISPGWPLILVWYVTIAAFVIWRKRSVSP